MTIKDEIIKEQQEEIEDLRRKNKIYCKVMGVAISNRDKSLNILKEALIAMDCCTSITWTGKRSNDFMDGSLQSLDIARAKLMTVMNKIEKMIGDDDANVS